MWWKINCVTSGSLEKRTRFCTLLYILRTWGDVAGLKYGKVKGECVLKHYQKYYFIIIQFSVISGLWHGSWRFLENHPRISIRSSTTANYNSAKFDSVVYHFLVFVVLQSGEIKKLIVALCACLLENTIISGLCNLGHQSQKSTHVARVVGRDRGEIKIPAKNYICPL